MMKAVVDRFEGKSAVPLLDQGERRIDVDRNRLREQAVEGSWLQVELDGDVIVSAKLDEGETQDGKARIAQKVHWLRRGDHLKDRDDGRG
jgi:hypothetical protein